jgi:hypothetical protein
VETIQEQLMLVLYLCRLNFIFDPTAAAGTDVQVSSTDTSKVILPKNAVITGITFTGAATGGSSPTIDMGYTDYDGGTDFVDIDGLLNEAVADGGITTVWGGDSTSGASLGNIALPSTEIIKIVGGQGASAATGGTITGIIYYYVKDSGKPGEVGPGA